MTKYLSEEYIKSETRTKAPVKFQNNQHKMVGGAVHARYTESDLVTLIVIIAKK